MLFHTVTFYTGQSQSYTMFSGKTNARRFVRRMYIRLQDQEEMDERAEAALTSTIRLGQVWVKNPAKLLRVLECDFARDDPGGAHYCFR